MNEFNVCLCKLYEYNMGWGSLCFIICKLFSELLKSISCFYLGYIVVVVGL